MQERYKTYPEKTLAHIKNNLMTIYHWTEKRAETWVQDLRASGEMMDKSPCMYRGIEYCHDCRACKGFKRTCSARSPEYPHIRDRNGNMRDSDP